ncbi:MAG: D-glycero-beta-D-manno-heptose 1,7-bisphosphate 7-phosphatase [Gammaproteobacteria bacterium]
MAVAQRGTNTGSSESPTSAARVIILDRDGVINEDSDEYIKSPQEWIPIPGSLEAIARLHRAGWRVVVATNQSGVARGLFDIDTLMRIHEKMHRAVEEAGGRIEAVFFCPHGPDDACQCRKPRPGLLREIAARLRIDLKGVPVVGDSLRDLQAAQAVGAKPILVRSGKGLRTLATLGETVPCSVHADLSAVADALIATDPQSN